MHKVKKDSKRHLRYQWQNCEKFKVTNFPAIAIDTQFSFTANVDYIPLSPWLWSHGDRLVGHILPKLFIIISLVMHIESACLLRRDIFLKLAKFTLKTFLNRLAKHMKNVSI